MAASAAATDRELVITRTFDAPCAVVFEAWTDPKHLVNWWGPFGFTTTIKQIDVRPGGVWRLVMHGPDGRDYHNRIVFIQVVPPSLLMFKHEPELSDDPSTHETTVTFEPEGQRTRLTLRMIFGSTAERDRVVKTYKADVGGQQTLERLADHLSASASKCVTLTRIFDAPRDLVWKAWTDPKHVANWWGPANFTTTVYEWNPQVGSRARIEMRSPDGSIIPAAGVFVEVVELERLTLRGGPRGANGEKMFETDKIVTLSEQPDGKTLLTLEINVITAGEKWRDCLASMEMGWTGSLERLAEEVKTLWN